MSTIFAVRSINVDHFDSPLAHTFMEGEGVPTDGTTGADVAKVGARYTDTLTGYIYINQGSLESPEWVLVNDVNVLTDSSALVYILTELRVISRLLASGKTNSSPESIRSDELRQLAAEVSLTASSGE